MTHRLFRRRHHRTNNRLLYRSIRNPLRGQSVQRGLRQRSTLKRFPFFIGDLPDLQSGGFPRLDLDWASRRVGHRVQGCVRRDDDGVSQVAVVENHVPTGRDVDHAIPEAAPKEAGTLADHPPEVDVVEFLLLDEHVAGVEAFDNKPVAVANRGVIGPGTARRRDLGDRHQGIDGAQVAGLPFAGKGLRGLAPKPFALPLRGVHFKHEGGQRLQHLHSVQLGLFGRQGCQHLHSGYLGSRAIRGEKLGALLKAAAQAGAERLLVPSRGRAVAQVDAISADGQPGHAYNARGNPVEACVGRKKREFGARHRLKRQKDQHHCNSNDDDNRHQGVFWNFASTHRYYPKIPLVTHLRANIARRSMGARP